MSATRKIVNGVEVRLSPAEAAAIEAEWAENEPGRGAKWLQEHGPNSEEARETRLRETARNAIATLEAADANWGTLTPQQRDAALRLSVRLGAKLARLAVRQLDSD